jgi:hypothetical protein
MNDAVVLMVRGQKDQPEKIRAIDVWGLTLAPH